MRTKNVFLENIEAHRKVLDECASLSEAVVKAADAMVSALLAGGRVFFCGNGGSAADAQHLAAELSGRYLMERKPLDGIALHTNTSALTAIGNDYGYDEVFARQLNAHGREGDVLIALSTSGNSKNIVKAIEAAGAKKIAIIGMTGKCGGTMKDICDILIAVPSDETPRIQEMHILIGHTLCQMAEEGIFARS